MFQGIAFSPDDFKPPHGWVPPPIATAPSASSAASAQSRSSKPKGSVIHSASTQLDSNLAKFSTADRTILEELKANIRAREAQFVVKGVGHTIVGGGRSPGKKHHPYSKKEVPYPRSYDTEVVDLCVFIRLSRILPSMATDNYPWFDATDISPSSAVVSLIISWFLTSRYFRDVWETMFHLDVGKGLSWHVFDTPPTKVYVLSPLLVV